MGTHVHVTSSDHTGVLTVYSEQDGRLTHEGVCLMQGVLNDVSLPLLANDTWRILDVSTTPVTISEAALLATTAGLPALQCLDVTG